MTREEAKQLKFGDRVKHVGGGQGVVVVTTPDHVEIRWEWAQRSQYLSLKYSSHDVKSWEYVVAV